MAEKVLMPQLGASMEKGTILQWYKREGEIVKSGEPLFEVMTDKTNIEIEAEHSGTIIKILHQVEEDVPVHQVIAYIGDAGEFISEKSNSPSITQRMDARTEAKSIDSSEATAKIEWINKLRRTPAARKFAEINQIDLRQVKGSGLNGRIHRSDVERYLAESPDTIKATPLARKVASEQQISLKDIKGSGTNGKIIRQDVVEKIQTPAKSKTLPNESVQTQKLDGIRKIIAERMVQSAFTAPHATLGTEVDMSKVIELRNQLLPVIKEACGERISYTVIILKAVAKALVKTPIINASLQDDTIIYHNQIHLGLAVAVPNGLVVPVIKDVDKLGLADLTKEAKQIGRNARDGKLKPDQLTGSTFTISNLGMYAIDSMTPIINQPESAILGVCQIKEKAVGINGVIELRPMMNLNLSIDHRLIDGAPAAQFLTHLKELLENPTLLMV